MDREKLEKILQEAIDNGEISVEEARREMRRWEEEDDPQAF